MKLKPTIITIRHPKNGEQQQPGWIVEGTNNLLAIDLRWDADIDSMPPQPAVYIITHIPTGYGINSPYAEAGTKERAAEIAKNFYDESVKRGWDLQSANQTKVIAPMLAASKEERLVFWKAVSAHKEKPETSTKPLESHH
jgi:hypothetical protein